MITIDGSRGEGGGQILRSSLALSLVTGRPFRIENIRAKRKKPGLMRQHLTAARAAAEVGGAQVRGADIGSTELEFTPGAVRPGNYTFAVGTAGSATLVLQTILPALITAGAPSHLVLEGGTHNPYAPPYDFLEKAFLPCLCKMGPRVTCRLERPGFYPAGGGRFTVDIEPAPALSPVNFTERGRLVEQRARAVVANLPSSIGRRELKVVQEKLGMAPDCLELVASVVTPGPGNVLIIEATYESVTEVFTGFGELGVSAERVAGRAVDQFRKHFSAEVPIGRYLADQLLIPMAMAGGGRFRTIKPTKHTTTNIGIIRRFLDVEIIGEKTGDVWEVIIDSRSGGPEGSPDNE